MQNHVTVQHELNDQISDGPNALQLSSVQHNKPLYASVPASLQLLCEAQELKTPADMLLRSNLFTNDELKTLNKLGPDELHLKRLYIVDK